jgi:hypothetical protein
MTSDLEDVGVNPTSGPAFGDIVAARLTRRRLKQPASLPSRSRESVGVRTG